MVACKAAGVYVTYLEDNKPRAEALLTEAVALAARAAAAAPALANAHYVHAFVLGRLSQRISDVKAPAAGHASRVRVSLERTLKLEPRHAEAHIALGLYLAEIVAEAGGLSAKRTYGASGDARRDEAVKLYERAASFAPLDTMERLDVELARAELD